MFYLAIIDWNNPEPEASEARRALDAVPGPAPAAAEIFRAPHAAFMTRPLYPGDPRVAGAFHRAPDGRVLLGDIRLHNRAEMAGALGADDPGAEAPDGAVVLAAHRRWGDAALERMLGDFAFVIWDPLAKTAYAARDAFGTRPLFHCAAGSRLALGSDPEALPTALGQRPEAHEGVVWDYLNWTHRHARETPWRGVRRVAGGHVLRVHADGRDERRWYFPPTETIKFTTDKERDEAYRESFGAAVARRLDPGAPMLAELSEGLDSSAVVLMADRIRRAAPNSSPNSSTNSSALPPLIAVTGTCPGLSCDEGPAVDILAVGLELGRETWNALESCWPEDEALTPCYHRGEPQLAGFQALYQMPARHGARAILSGHGGDEAVHEGGLYQDLALAGKWGELARCTILSPNAPWPKRWGSFKAAVLTATPAGARRAFRTLRPREGDPIPDWAGPVFSRGAPTPEPDDAEEPTTFASRTQEYTWRAMNDPALSWAIEGLQLDAMRRGFERRFPFLDAAFVRFVLSIHWKNRINRGWSKFLTREAFRGLMPETIRTKRDAVTYQEYIRWHVRAQLPRIRQVIEDGPWLSGPFVDRGVARNLLSRIEFAKVRPPQWGRCRLLWAISRLELWLRRIDAIRTGGR